MIKYGLILVIILLISFLPVYAEYSDFYGDYSDFWQLFIDPNTGLTIFPTLLIPIGGKLEGMGTAYTAMANDSGYIESNPAGSAGLDFDELAILHHAWIADSNIEGIIYASRMGNLGYGVSGKFLYIPFTHYNAWGDRAASDFISESILTANVSYNLFSSPYFYGLLIGVNAKLAYRNIPEVIYPGQSTLGVMGDFGILTRFDFLKFFVSRNKNLSIGATLKNLGLPALDEPLPTLFSCGIAYTFINPITLAVDYNLPISFDPVNYPAQLWYLAFGMNIDFTKFISLQAGFVLKENPRISIGAALDLNEVQIVTNYNLDLSGSLNPADKFSVEAKIKLNYKEHMQLRQKVDELFAKGLEAYAEGDFKLALEYWEETLKLDPKFSIALEYIETTRKFIDLQKDMEDKQKM
ncbi:MAG: UPF0164 family protein [Spirochaetales bacterium]|nr:UPF0164 family protein [Spirochaetales bacterium]